MRMTPEMDILMKPLLKTILIVEAIGRANKSNQLKCNSLEYDVSSNCIPHELRLSPKQTPRQTPTIP